MEIDFQTYTITYNGQPETWYLSDKDMTHNQAMGFIDKHGKKAPDLSDLVTKDNTGKTRLELLHDAVDKGWAWCKDGPFGMPGLAAYVRLSYGYVGYANRYYSRVCQALCRD